MPDRRDPSTRKVGLAPGTLSYVGPARDFTPEATHITYGAEHIGVEKLGSREDLSDAPRFLPDRVDWLRVAGLHDVELVRRVSDWLGAHPFIQEDILNTTQRPKLEEDEEAIFITVKGFSIAEKSDQAGLLPDVLMQEQLSIFWTEQTVASFQESNNGVWDWVRKRLKRRGSRIRSAGADYLVVALLDAVVDGYFVTLSELARRIEELETRVVADQSETVLLSIFTLRREVLVMRNALAPLEDILVRLTRQEQDRFAESTLPYLRDVHDHALQVVDSLRTQHDMLSGLLDMYVSLVGLKTNQIMKVLTIIGAIFIPLTFIAGVYGMNFEYMPELGWRYGYFLVLGLMGVLGLGLVLYFARKKWF